MPKLAQFLILDHGRGAPFDVLLQEGWISVQCPVCQAVMRMDAPVFRIGFGRKLREFADDHWHRGRSGVDFEFDVSAEPT